MSGTRALARGEMSAAANLDGLQGARICCGHGVFAHNLVKIGGLLEARHSTAA